MIQILIGGDVCPIGNIERAFADGNASEIFHDLLEDISACDLSVVNLECPLTMRPTPITKSGPVLGSDVTVINGLAASKWDVVNLANNHSFDHGLLGLQTTIKTLEAAGLKVVGAGLNISDAQTPFVKHVKGRRVVVYSMAEHEFSVADERIGGSNPLDLINFVNAVRQYKQEGIFLTLVHGGNEHYPYPSPEMVRRCRFMVDMGADAVVCCHAHCPLPWEIYGGKPIIYGLGNLVFEALGQEPRSWYEGYLAELAIEDDKILFRAIPYFQSGEKSGAEKMDGESMKRFFDEMESKCAEIVSSTALEDRWKAYCRKQTSSYLAGLLGYNRLMRRLTDFLPGRTLHPKKAILRSLLLTQCEAHREVLNTILRDQRKEE